jgi:hypothetical protein
MTATKKKQPSKSGGTLMSMRSGFQKMTTGGSKKRTTRSKWTFQQVMLAVAAVAVIIAVFYALSKR